MKTSDWERMVQSLSAEEFAGLSALAVEMAKLKLKQVPDVILQNFAQDIFQQLVAALLQEKLTTAKKAYEFWKDVAPSAGWGCKATTKEEAAPMMEDEEYDRRALDLLERLNGLTIADAQAVLRLADRWLCSTHRVQVVANPDFQAVRAERPPVSAE